MKYALGNILNGAGGLNPDGLSLDLQFAADKTLTARKGPTPVFTRGSTATFIGSDGLIQSAVINAARFDHDTLTPFACRGLLMEESRTNLLASSQLFDNASYWTVIRSTVTANATTSPDGTTTADKLIADTTAANTHRVDRASVTLALNSVYTISVFAKASEYTGLALGVGLSSTEGVRFSLVGSGTATPVAGGNTGTIQQLGNGWYKCTCTFTSDAATASHRAAIYVGQNGTTFTYTGNNTSGIFIWGAQLELGSFSTSYIPTTLSALTRSADVCSITSADFTGMYNQDEGSLLVNAFTSANGNRTIVASDNNTADEMVRLRTEGIDPFFRVTDGGSDLVAIDSGTVIANTAFKLAGAYKVNDFASVINGGTVGTDVAGTIPTADRMRIGAGQAGNTMCGCISSLRYYKKRLSDAKLQTLTA